MLQKNENNTIPFDGYQERCFDIIQSNISEDKCSAISLETNFSDAAIDSITFIKIVVALETAFDFEFDDEMLLITKFPTVKLMIEYVESKTTTNCEICYFHSLAIMRICYI